MTTHTAPPPTAVAAKPPLRVFLTILHLAGVGVIGGFIFTTLGGLLGTGLGLLFAAGIGVVLLVGLVYALFGVGWFEVARIGALYRTPIAPLRLRPRERPGFVGWLRSLGRQAIDGRMWRAVANFAIAAILGWIVLRLAWSFVWSAFIAFAPFTGAEFVMGPFGGGGIAVEWAPLVGILGIAASGFGIFGLALLHRTLSLAIVVRSREAELTERVRTTTAQRAGAVRAADVERTRIERDLHDGVQPRLVSVGMTLGLAQQRDRQRSGCREGAHRGGAHLHEGGHHRTAPARPRHPRLGARRPRSGCGALRPRRPLPHPRASRRAHGWALQPRGGSRRVLRHRGVAHQCGEALPGQ
ncbi:histidine kinase [Microbacterium sp. W4I20]|uniref:histidine kinase n=1 Tax=Microbacterium sp. W4I20 TaxID=3042262 RepID=UPI00358DE081